MIWTRMGRDEWRMIVLAMTMVAVFVLAGCVPGQRIEGVVWEDANGDGLRDLSEYSAPGVVVRLWGQSDTEPVAETTTDESGAYELELGGVAEPILEIVAPDGSSFSPQDQTFGDNLDSDVDAGGRLELDGYQGDLEHVDAGLVPSALVDAGETEAAASPTPTPTPTPTATATATPEPADPVDTPQTPEPTSTEQLSVMDRKLIAAIEDTIASLEDAGPENDLFNPYTLDPPETEDPFAAIYGDQVAGIHDLHSLEIFDLGGNQLGLTVTLGTTDSWPELVETAVAEHPEFVVAVSVQWHQPDEARPSEVTWQPDGWGNYSITYMVSEAGPVEAHGRVEDGEWVQSSTDFFEWELWEQGLVLIADRQPWMEQAYVFATSAAWNDEAVWMDVVGFDPFTESWEPEAQLP
jgi:hypothetical protein